MTLYTIAARERTGYALATRNGNLSELDLEKSSSWKENDNI
jgi:hypothetical protein